MNGKTIRVTTVPYMPHIKVTTNSQGNYVLSGPAGNIFNSLAAVLRFNYTIVLAPEATTGSPQPDGTWTGLMGMLFRNESDLAVGTFFPAEERLEIANPTTMFYQERLRILAGRSRAQDSSIFGYVLAFDWMVWTILSAALLITTLVTGIAQGFYDTKRLTWTRFLGNLSNALWMYLENLFMEGSAAPPQRSVLRLLSGVWWLAIIVLMNAFCGHMRACLMIRSEVERIDSVRQLTQKPSMEPYMWKGTSYVGMLARSTNEDLRKIGRVVEERGTAQPASILYGEALLKRVAQGRAVVISDGTSLVYRVSNVCGAFRESEFYLAKEGLVSHPLNHFLRKDVGPEFHAGVNRVIRRLVEAGLVDHWWTAATGDMSRCGGSIQPDSATTLALSDLWGIFVLWLVSLGCAAAAFCCELCVHRALSSTALCGGRFCRPCSGPPQAVVDAH